MDPEDLKGWQIDHAADVKLPDGVTWCSTAATDAVFATASVVAEEALPSRRFRLLLLEDCSFQTRRAPAAPFRRKTRRRNNRVIASRVQHRQPKVPAVADLFSLVNYR